jgi:uncharacterized membrane protein YfcA
VNHSTRTIRASPHWVRGELIRDRVWEALADVSVRASRCVWQREWEGARRRPLGCGVGAPCTRRTPRVAPEPDAFAGNGVRRMPPLTALQDVLAVFSGAAVGFSLGLLGGGGSILAVPLLLYVVGIRDPHRVIGTTALAVAATAVVNLIPHARAHHVRWGPAITFGVAGASGAVLGSSLGKAIGGQQLLLAFALLMLVVAGFMVRPRASGSGPVRHSARGPLHRVAVLGVAAGLLSGFFGIGGGFLIVPGLVWGAGLSMIDAIGSSLVSVGTFGFATAATYALSGLVLWRVALAYVVGGILGGVVGERLAVHLTRRQGMLNVLFAAVVALVALYMLSRSAAALHLLPTGL